MRRAEARSPSCPYPLHSLLSLIFPTNYLTIFPWPDLTQRQSWIPIGPLTTTPSSRQLEKMVKSSSGKSMRTTSKDGPKSTGNLAILILLL